MTGPCTSVSIRIAIAVWLAVTACGADAWPAAGAPDLELLDRIERSAKLPVGAAPLGSYARFYSLTTLRRISARAPDDRPMVSAVYIRGEGAPGRIVVAPEALPRRTGGGCGVVTLYYDIQGARWSGIHCNPAR